MVQNYENRIRNNEVMTYLNSPYFWKTFLDQSAVASIQLSYPHNFLPAALQFTVNNRISTFQSATVLQRHLHNMTSKVDSKELVGGKQTKQIRYHPAPNTGKLNLFCHY